MNFKSTRCGNSIYDELKERLYIQRLIDIETVSQTYVEEDLDKELESIDDNYDFNLFKLDELASLANKTDDVKRKFISQKLYIENIDIPEQSKLENILTFACLLNRHSKLLINLSENQLYILSIISLNIGSKYGIDWNYEPIINNLSNILFDYEDIQNLDQKQYTLK